MGLFRRKRFGKQEDERRPRCRDRVPSGAVTCIPAVAYQLTAAKAGRLQQGRTRLRLAREAIPGAGGGLRHGAYCVGRCAGLAPSPGLTRPGSMAGM